MIKNRSVYRCWWLMFAGLILAGSAGAGVPDGMAVPNYISNEQNPVQINWELEELWTLGGAEEDDQPLGFIGGVVYQDSLVYILDTKDSLVYIMNLEGRCLDLVNVEGDGPGQCSHPNTILAMGDNMLALVKGMPAKVIVTDFFYTYPKSSDLFIPEAGDYDDYSVVITSGVRNYGYHFLAYTETTIILDIKKPDFKTVKALSLFGEDGEELVRLFSDEAGKLESDVFKEADVPHYAYPSRFAFSEHGRIFAVPYRNEYLIYVFSNSGVLEEVIGREYQSRKRSDYEIEMVSFSGQHGGNSFEIDVEPTEADILDIYTACGDLLVRTSRSEIDLPVGVYTRLDLFEDGRFAGQVNILGEGTAQRDQLIFLGDDLLAIVRGNLDAVQYGIENFVAGYEAVPVQVSLYRIK